MRKTAVVLTAFIMVVAIALMAVANTSCAKAPEVSAPTPGGKAVPVELTMGIVAPMSGPWAVFGMLHKAGFETAAKLINDAGGFVVKDKSYNWKVVAYDDRQDAAEAVSAATKFISQGVKFLSVNSGAMSITCQGVTDRANVLCWTWGNLGKKGFNKYTFQNQQEGEVNATCYPFLKDKFKLQNFVILGVNDAGGRDRADFSKFVADRIGLKMLGAEFFESGTTDFYPVLTRIIATKPDMIDLSNTPPDSVALVLKQLNELKYSGIVWGSGAAADVSLIMQTAGKGGAEGFCIPLLFSESPQKQAWKDAYIAMHGTGQWIDFCYLLHHGMYAITQAIQETQSLEPKTLAEYIPTMTIKNHIFQPYQPRFVGKDYYGFNHIVAISGAVGQIKDGKVVNISGDLGLEKGILD